MRFTIFFLLLACACGARSELGAPIHEDASVADVRHDVSAHDVAVADVAEEPPPSSPLCSAYDGGIPDVLCKASLKVGPISTSMSTCYVDLVVHQYDQGLAWFDCAETDAGSYARADFPGGTFLGSIQNNVIDVCTGTTFPWSDGCTWASAQRISGDLTSGTLTFTYTETPIEGTGCLTPCSASGTVLVQ